MRKQGRFRSSSRQKSAFYSSSKEEVDHGSRSISAPVFGLAALGQREDPDYRRRKQLKYAAELKEQIREKREAQRKEMGETDRSSRRYNVDQTNHPRRKERARSPPEGPMYARGYHQQRDPHPYADDRDIQPNPAARARDRYFNYPPDPPRYRYPPDHGYYAPAYDPYLYPRYPPYPHYPPPPPPHYPKFYPPPEPHQSYMENPYLPSARRRGEWSRNSDRSPSPPRPRRQEVQSVNRREETDGGYHELPTSGPRGPSSKTAYQQELRRQIEEKRERQQQDKREKERYFSKLEEEAKNYNPWGKPGAGAPLRDEKGNIVATRGLRSSVDATSPRFTQLTEEELKKLTQEKHAHDLSQQVTPLYNN